jgi:hypothetical protein
MSKTDANELFRKILSAIRDEDRLNWIISDLESLSNKAYKDGQEDMRQRATDLAYNMDEESECTACSGSGYYDHNGSPRCGACNGNGYIKSTNNDVGYSISKLEIKSQE